MSLMKRFLEWLKRAFIGGEREEIITPSKLIWSSFFRRKTAVAAIILFFGLFLFVFIAPAFVKMDLNYTDPLQQNVGPIYSLRNVPRGLTENVAEIDGFSGFTIGKNAKGVAFVWGNTKDRLTGIDMKELPEKVRNEGVTLVAAGKDHALALTKEGYLVGWGDKSCGQYGTEQVLNALPMPTSLTERLAVEDVAAISCGYQASALVKTDGSAYLWGNLNAVRNLSSLQ